MKKIGLLGGTSWHSSLDYYQLLNQKIAARVGGLHSADLVLRSVNFATFHQLQEQGAWDEIANAYSKDAIAMKSMGVEALVICANTMHQVAAEVERQSQLPVLHIATALQRSVKQIKPNETATLGVLGTEYTMTLPFYREALAQYGVAMLVPVAEQRQRVHQIIFSELVAGVVTAESRDFYLQQIKQLAEQGADAVVLGCTEIGMLVQQTMTDIPLIDSLQSHVDYIVDFCLE
ncbi:MAG: amino acid racemase [Gammaproteobacteria bacterium]|nr:amino acid racemase [Gammaproteobacteria bacterium]